uniref:hypothetical protein n=1 Tax=Prevotella sp. TaxID=59823 RepID=UPI00402785C6
PSFSLSGNQTSACPATKHFGALRLFTEKIFGDLTAFSPKTFGDIEKIYNFVTIKKTNRPVATGFTVVYRAGLKVTKNE